MPAFSTKSRAGGGSSLMSKMRNAAQRTGHSHAPVAHAPAVINVSREYIFSIRDNETNPPTEHTFTLPAATVSFEALSETVSNQFGYTRDPIIKIALMQEPGLNAPSPTGRAPSPTPFNPTDSHPARKTMLASTTLDPSTLASDQTLAPVLFTTVDLKKAVKAFHANAPQRRIARVQTIRSDILKNIQAEATVESVLGLNRFWELIQRESNMHACDREMLVEVEKRLKHVDFAIGEAAARVVWKLSSHPTIFGTLTSAKSDIPRLLLNNLMRRTKHPTSAQDDENDSYYFTTLGAFLSLVQDPTGVPSPHVQPLLVNHAGALLEACVRGSHISTKKLAAESLSRVLATSRTARKTVAATGKIPNIAHLLQSSNTYVVRAAAACINVYARTPQDRKMIKGCDVLDLFHGALKACLWCKSEMESTLEVVTSESMTKPHQHHYAGSSQDLVEGILEYSSSALWGFAVVLDNDDHAKELIQSDEREDGMGWLDSLLDLVKFHDVRLQSVVTTAIAGALGVLSASLACEMSSVPNAFTSILRACTTSTYPPALECLSSALAHMCKDDPSVLKDQIENHFAVEEVMKIWSTMITSNPANLLPILKNLASTLIYMANSSHSTWPVERLSLLVPTLNQRNPSTLNSLTATIWSLSRCPTNRKVLGNLWAVTGLLQILNSYSDLTLKERTLGALWLLAGEPKNAVRLALGGGIQTLASFLNFADEATYTPLKTLTVGLLFHIQSNPDIFALMKQLNIEESLANLLTSAHITPYLHVQLAGLLYFMSLDATCRGRLAAITGKKGGPNPFYLEDMFSDMVFRDNEEVQMLGVFGVTLQAMSVGAKRHFSKNKVISGIGLMLTDEVKFRRGDRVKMLHAVLNLSQDDGNKKQISANFLPELIKHARGGSTATSETQSMLSEFASSILSNLSNHGDCRAEMYKTTLSCAGAALEGLHRTMAGGESTVKTILQMDSAHLFETVDHVGGVTATVLQRRQAMEAAAEVNTKAEEAARRKLKSSLGRPVTSLWEDEPVENQMAKAAETVRMADFMTKAGASWHSKSQTTLAKMSVLSVGGKEGKEGGILGSTVPHLSANGKKKSLTFSNDEEKKDDGEGNDDEKNEEGEEEDDDDDEGDDEDPERPSSSPATYSRPNLKMRRGRTPKILAPLRSSHRVGPVGRLGSSDTVEGENRWRPPIISYDKSTASTFENPDNGVVVTSGVKTANSEKISGAKYSITLLPPVHYNKFNFNTNKHMKLDERTSIKKPSPVTLHMWKKSNGSSIGHGLFEHFVSESGETMYFYHTSSVVCEALEPGPYPRTALPDTLHHILQSSYPSPPAVRQPMGDVASAKPYIPCVMPCPPIDKHYIPLCSLATKASLRSMKPSYEQIKRANMFGAIPAEPLRLICSMEPLEVESSEEEEEEEEAKEVEAKEEVLWTLDESVFKDRKKRADSKDFFDTPKVVERSLGTDFERMLKEPRLAKLIAKEDAEVKSGEANVEKELDEIKTALLPLYKTIIHAFEYYCLIANNFTRTAFEMGENSYNRFCVDCKLIDKKFSTESASQVFVAVNFESDKKSAESAINEDKCLMRMEFIEVIIRAAIIKYKEDAGGDVSTAVEMLVQKNLEPNIPPEGKVNSDAFRRDRMYSKQVEEVIMKHREALEVVYEKYKHFKPVAGLAIFSIPQWIQFLKDTRMLEEHNDDFSAREAMLAFFNSRMCVVDEVKGRNRYISLSFVDFVEALGRVADMITVPLGKDIEDIAGFGGNMIGYKLAVKKGGKNEEEKKRMLVRRPSTAFLVTSERGLAEKLDKTVELIMGSIGLMNKGYLQYEKHRVHLVPHYITEEQLREDGA